MINHLAISFHLFKIDCKFLLIKVFDWKNLLFFHGEFEGRWAHLDILAEVPAWFAVVGVAVHAAFGRSFEYQWS